MSEPNAIVVDGCRQVAGTVSRALSATGYVSYVAHSTEQAMEELKLRRYDLMVIDYDGEIDRKVVLEAARHLYPECRTILVTKEAPHEYVRKLGQNDFVQNLIAKKMGLIAQLQPLDLTELIVTITKLKTGRIFGLEKYFPWGSRLGRVTIRDSHAKQDYIERVLGYARRFTPRERVVAVLNVVADEFITNAIYNAPRDANGAHKYLRRSRRERVVLEPQEKATLRYGSDGRTFGISVSDPFGALEREQILRYLVRCFARKAHDKIAPDKESGGAGLGFYMSFNFIKNFVINIERGRRTEIIGLLDLEGARPSGEQASKSFHVFLKEGRGDG